ncbi:8-oxoguanine DNA glycosylase [Caballeronia fortuita]|uniref:8-oxoguanine DNA glycosylase n=1 Tax=Caballeronia fortuita TaxID=1777138 RepID=UPI0007726564|nr:hypothetical protein [Caballeronia fortuita]
MSNDDLWMRLVSQICVRGSARGMDAVTGSRGTKDSFIQAISLHDWQKRNLDEEYFSDILKRFKATRFHNEAARSLRKIAKCETAIRGGKVVLLAELDQCSANSALQREHILKRCPVLGWKSVSDFMIETGVSDDVIALDTRIVKLLQKHFGYNVPVGRVQSSEALYMSLENALREACAEVKVPLALLDRLLFRLSGMSVIDFFMKYGAAGLEFNAASISE